MKKQLKKHLPTFHNAWHQKVTVYPFRKILIGIAIISIIILALTVLNIINQTNEEAQTTQTRASEQEDEEFLSEITVCPDDSAEECEYKGVDGLQQAINRSFARNSEETTIYLEQGLYHKPNWQAPEYDILNRDKEACMLYINNKHINLVGLGDNQSVRISAENQGIYNGICIVNSRVTIDSITVEKMQEDFTQSQSEDKKGGNGILISGDANTDVFVKHSYIQNNANSGIRALSDIKLNLQNSVIRNNGLTGLNLYGQTNSILVNNVLQNNGGTGEILWDREGSPEARNAVFLYGDATGTIKNNIFISNAEGELNTQFKTDIALQNNAGATVQYNHFFSNGGPVRADDRGVRLTFSNYRERTNPLLTDVTNRDYTLQPNSPAIDAGDPTILDPDGSRSDIGPNGGPEACLFNPRLEGCIGSDITRNATSDYLFVGYLSENPQTIHYRYCEFTVENKSPQLGNCDTDFISETVPTDTGSAKGFGAYTLVDSSGNQVLYLVVVDTNGSSHWQKACPVTPNGPDCQNARWQEQGRFGSLVNGDTGNAESEYHTVGVMRQKFKPGIGYETAFSLINPSGTYSWAKICPQRTTEPRFFGSDNCESPWYPIPNEIPITAYDGYNYRYGSNGQAIAQYVEREGRLQVRTCFDLQNTVSEDVFEGCNFSDSNVAEKLFGNNRFEDFALARISR